MVRRQAETRMRIFHATLLLVCAAAALTLLAADAQARIAVSRNYRMDVAKTPARGLDSVGLAVDPRNPRHIVEINADWTAGQCQHHVSFDGGRTWRGGAFRPPAGFEPAPCTVGPHLAEHINAGIAYGSDGNVYATFASSRKKPDGTDEGKSLLGVVSRDGGRTWGRAFVIAPGGPNPTDGPHYILPTIGVEPARRGGPRQDRVVVAAGGNLAEHEGTSSENVAYSISNDAGRTWSAIANANAPTENALEQSRPVFGRDGTIYLAWRDRGRGSTPGTFTPDGFIVVARSRDGGKTWTRVQSAPVHGYVYMGPPVPPFTGSTVFTASSFPRMAIDQKRNILYVVYGQGPPQPGESPSRSTAVSARAHAADHFINPDQDVLIERSTDGAKTWSHPEAINTQPPIDTEITQTRHPWVSVAPNGRVDVVWQDRRHWYRGCTNTHVACEEARLGDTYYAYSTDHGRTWSRNYRLSDRSTNNDVGFDYRFGTYWAYGPVAVSTGRNTLLVGWMDSRAGNVQNDNQDIYLARVRLGARGPVPVQRLTDRSLPDYAVRLSRLAYPGGGEAVLAATFASRPWTRVVIANERDVSGVLAGGVLARANIGPVLLSPAAGLTRRDVAEIRRLGPIGAYVIGNDAQLSPAVVSDLVAAGVPSDQIVRLAGTDTADTARLIAEAADRRTAAQKQAGTPAFNAAIVTNPNSADAVTAAVLAANRRLPVLYVAGDSIPAATSQALSELNINFTLVVGGRSAVSDTLMAQLPQAHRLGGGNAFATSLRVAKQSWLRGVPSNIVYVTDGKNPMEAALLGAAVGRIGGLQLVSRHGASGALRTIRRSRTFNDQVTRVIAVRRR